MDSNKKLEQARPEPQISDVRQVREISKDELKEVAGGCGDMGGVVVIRF
ncbi:MAG: hypothetical protein JOY71_18110 [Acetobacteraceae bacterium]|nr:hypothetical protein [Acetobacteraceae bacterium]MBV8524009.1 hypothetical protein [Acetobacteraceae bacterium]MBV8588747.1 hypothetical protein [Acetobacteraceae bacterium]